MGEGTHVEAVVLSGDESRVLNEDDIGTLEELRERGKGRLVSERRGRETTKERRSTTHLLGSRSRVVGELKGQLISDGKTSGSKVGLVDAWDGKRKEERERVSNQTKGERRFKGG